MPKEQILEQLLANTTGPKVFEKDGKLFFDLVPIYFDYDRWNIRVESTRNYLALEAYVNARRMRFKGCG